MSKEWLILRSGPGLAAENMAWDEALLESIAALGRPLLRLYEWNESAATFGYFQKIADVESMTKLSPLIRRPTGGGLVPHDADWTYSLVVPPSDAWYQLRAPESYRRMHEWILAAFDRLDLPAELAHAKRIEAPGQCFVGAEQFDVLARGRKIAGAAQRRNRNGLLIQGSIQPPPGLDRDEFENSLCEAAVAQWAVAWQSFPIRDPLRRRAMELSANKYSRDSHNRRR
jgi:lipoyl(octanoyl) transferase